VTLRTAVIGPAAAMNKGSVGSTSIVSSASIECLRWLLEAVHLLDVRSSTPGTAAVKSAAEQNHPQHQHLLLSALFWCVWRLLRVDMQRGTEAIERLLRAIHMRDAYVRSGWVAPVLRIGWLECIEDFLDAGAGHLRLRLPAQARAYYAKVVRWAQLSTTLPANTLPGADGNENDLPSKLDTAPWLKVPKPESASLHALLTYDKMVRDARSLLICCSTDWFVPLSIAGRCGFTGAHRYDGAFVFSLSFAFHHLFHLHHSCLCSCERCSACAARTAPQSAGRYRASRRTSAQLSSVWRGATAAHACGGRAAAGAGPLLCTLCSIQRVLTARPSARQSADRSTER
jgi:hypothetical protein